MSNADHIRGSAWINFPRILCERWSHENLVLMGDAAATAHFSIGSGTKLALESAIFLSSELHRGVDLATVFRNYEDARRTEVLKLQSAANNSLEWFEDIERYLGLDPIQFNYALLTRSQRISHEICDCEMQNGSLRPRNGSNDAPVRCQMARAPRCSLRFVCATCNSLTAWSSRQWRNTELWTAAPPIGISFITPNARRAGRRWW